MAGLELGDKDDFVEVASVVGISGGKTFPGALSWALPSITWQF